MCHIELIRIRIATLCFVQNQQPSTAESDIAHLQVVF